MRAVGALQADPAYKDKIDTEIIAMDSDRGKMSQLLYEWGPDAHGLVVIGPDDSVLAVLKGHSWGGRDLDTAFAKLKETLDPLL